jgi:hypothetical protein
MDEKEILREVVILINRLEDQLAGDVYANETTTKENLIKRLEYAWEETRNILTYYHKNMNKLLGEMING